MQNILNQITAEQWCYFNENYDSYVVIHTLDVNEVAAIIAWVEQHGLDNPSVREGYIIECYGSSAKFAQGSNWAIKISFETPLQYSIFVEKCKKEFGERLEGKNFDAHSLFY